MPLKRLQELGYRAVIVPSDLQRAAIRAMQEVRAAIARDGNSAAADRMLSFAQREAVIGTKALLERAKRYAERAPHDLGH
jgi:2-methylisocitrate lyase-like PEP mutase family enzyme